MGLETGERRDYLGWARDGVKSILLLALLFGTLAVKVLKKDSD